MTTEPDIEPLYLHPHGAANEAVTLHEGPVAIEGSATGTGTLVLRWLPSTDLRLEAELSEPVDDARTPGASGVLGPGSAGILEQLLTMPRARLLVDGYNVSKGAWAGSSLEAQRQRLLRSLAPLVARTGVETTVVFDAANLTSRPVVAAPRAVDVRMGDWAGDVTCLHRYRSVG